MGRKSKRKGRKYERELKAYLEDRVFVVKDVTPNAGEYARSECDLLVNLDPDAEVVDPFGLQEGPLPTLPRDLRVEAKYRRKARGFTHLYHTHLDTIGLGTQWGVRWDGAFCSGGVGAFMFFLEKVAHGRGDLGQGFIGVDEGVLTNTLEGWFFPDNMPARDVVAVRADGNKMWTKRWIFVWPFELDLEW